MSSFGRFGRGPRPLRRLIVVLALLVTGFAAGRQIASARVHPGYWLVATDGGVFALGQAGFHGSTGAMSLNQPIVAMAPTPRGAGYWLVATDGGVFAFGDASFYGSTGAMALNQPIVAMAPTPRGAGYWLVASDGGVFAFGDAAFYGSPGPPASRPVVDLAPTPSGAGYWLVTSDGAIFAYGDAGFYASTDPNLVQRIQAIAPTPTGRGYWLVASDGGVFAFGDAPFLGSASGPDERRILDIAATPSGGGYYLVDRAGSVYPFGDAEFLGDARDLGLNKRITGIAVVGDDTGPTAVDDVAAVAEDEWVSLDVLANDGDLQGDGLTLAGVFPPAHGKALATSLSRITYRPGPDYYGSDSFVYTVKNRNGEVATAAVAVTVAPVDDRPRAEDDTAIAEEGAPVVIPVLGNDSGLGDGGIVVQALDSPAGDTVTVNPDQTITYVSSSGDGRRTPVSFTYQVTDADGDRSQATVSIEANRLPRALDDTQDALKRETTTIDVLLNDTPGNGAVAVELFPLRGVGMERFSVNQDRTVGFSSEESGTFRVGYRFTDGDGDRSNEAQIEVRVDNRRPLARDDVGAPGVIHVLGNDDDPDGDGLRIVELRGELKGGVDCRSQTECVYTPPEGGSEAEERFEYRIGDDDPDHPKASDWATVVIPPTSPSPPDGH